MLIVVVHGYTVLVGELAGGSGGCWQAGVFEFASGRCLQAGVVGRRGGVLGCFRHGNYSLH